MARDGRKQALRPDDEQEEMTVVILRFKGGGETLRKGFDTVTQALRQIGPVTQLTSSKSLPRPVDSTTNGIDDSDDSKADLDSMTNEGVDATEVEASGRPDRTIRVRKPPKMPKMLNDLDIKTGPKSLEDYAKEKMPETTQDKFVVIGAWFLNHRKLEEITVDHIFTCFPLLDWSRPDDIGSVFRDLKNKKQWYDKGAKPNAWKLTITGLNYVDNKLPKSDA